MLKTIAVTATVVGNFTAYPGFLDPQAVVQAVTDRGPILEMIIRCDSGPEGILSYSKVEEVFCTADMKCYRDLDRAISTICR